LEIFSDNSALRTQKFLNHLIEKAGFKITTVLTGNGQELTDRLIANGEP
jgi:hypothetical protein